MHSPPSKYSQKQAYRELETVKSQLEKEKLYAKELRAKFLNHSTEENQELKEEIKKLKKLLLQPEKESANQPPDMNTINELQFAKKTVKKL